jgi:hypothetical protein
MTIFYNTDGIPTNKPKDNKFWIQKFNDQILLKEGDITSDIDYACVRLHDLLATKIFGDKQIYYRMLPSIPMWMVYGGIDSDIKISKEQFEKIVGKGERDEVFNKLLYFYDCRNLISTLQNAVIEAKYLFGQFYRLLNEEDFLLADKRPLDPNNIQFASGLIVTNIISTINYFFINLYSQLDFVTKVAYEFENLIADFSKYPKLKSSNLLFGDNKKLSISGCEGSLFEASSNTDTIMTIRNEIVHNSSYDNMPKVYQVFSAGTLIEKYILLPDLQNGRLKTFKNRKRFFDNDVRLNDILPSLTIEFWKRLKITLDNIK